MKKLTVLAGSGRTQPKASQGKISLLAGPLSLIFGSVNVAASDSAEVTVSMTSEDSAGYGKCDSGSHLSSPQSGSAKYRQRRSTKPGVTVTSRNIVNGVASAHMAGVCPDNPLNIKAESVFVQASDIVQTLCVTIGNSQNQQGLGSLSLRHVQKNDFRTLEDVQATVEKKGSIGSATLRHGEEVGQLWDSCLALLRSRRLISVCMEVTINWASLSPISFTHSISLIISCGTRACIFLDLALTTFVGTDEISAYFGKLVYIKSWSKKCLTWTPLMNYCGVHLEFKKVKMTRPEGAVNTTQASNHNVTGGNIMACSHDTQTRPKFLETYWIIPEYSTTPYGKVSLTRQDRRTFIALFKDSRLIWAGRQPVQRGGKITPPSTITEIVTVQKVAHV